MTQRQAVLELVCAGAIWGFGFIAAKWSLVGFSPVWSTALRFMIAGAAVSVWLVRNRTTDSWRMLAWTAALPAFSLGGTLFFQTWGMQHTTATNSSFITILYVVFVPLLETIVLRKAPPRILWLWIVAALAGAALMCRLHELKLNVGDMLTLCCAFLAAVHILLTGWAVRRIQSPFLFNGWTAVMSAALLWPLAVATEGWPHLPTELTPWLGIAYLSLVSTLVAFLLQVRAQRVLSPSLSSMLFLLESPFGALFAYAVLGERLLPGQWLGAGIILIAAFGATRSCES